MSLAEQIQRVDGSQNEILKSFLAAFGVTVGSNKIDQLAALAKAAPLLKENGILAGDTKTSLGLSADATVNDVFAKLSKAALVGADGGLVTPSGETIGQVRIKSGTYVGNGQVGEGSPNSITVDFDPKFMAISSTTAGRSGTDGTGIFVAGAANGLYIKDGKGSTAGTLELATSVSGNTISWYVLEGSDAYTQLNENGRTYAYVVIGS